MPNPPKPIEQKRRVGTFRPDRAGGKPTLAVVEPVGVVPDFDAAKLFDQVLEDGVHWLARTDSPTLALLRDMMHERVELRVIANGSMEARRALRELDKIILSTLSQLGFDPTARSRLGLAEVKAMSKLEQMQADRDKRR